MTGSIDNVTSVHGPQESSHSSPGVSDSQMMNLLGDLRKSVHATAEKMAAFESPHSPGDTLMKGLIGGVALCALHPAIGIGVMALGVAGAILEAGLTTAVNLTGQGISYLTQPPPNK